MIHAGADAGIYELKQMAFETMESFLRAGTSHYSLVLTGY
jgi:delta-aminolevulinic acid dehydratase/porphobilinogen synthase